MYNKLMNSPIKIATRSSPLALVQINEIILELKAKGIAIAFESITFETAGDIDKNTPLTQSSDDFFTDTIDRALLEGKADIAIHSAKDLPQNLNDDLIIFALTKGLDDKDAWVSPLHWKDLPPKAKVGTSSVLRQKQILQMRPDVTIVNIRGTINERLQLVKDGKVDGVVVAACALKRLHLDNEIKDIFPWEGMPLQGQLAVVGRRSDFELEHLFGNIDSRRSYGKVTLIGAGPGDPELITLKGIKALEVSDCVFYDYLVDSTLLKYAPKAEHIYAGKRKGEHSLAQEDLSRMLKEKAFAGKNVARLKGGDPLIFGRGADEIQYLRSYHIHVEIIPGVSSATGIPSSLGIPLTARGISSSVAFLSGHEEDEDKTVPKLINIPQADTLVFLMGLTKLNAIIQSLIKSHWPIETPIMIVASGTKHQEKIVKGILSSIEELALKNEIKPPALILVGKTIELYRQTKIKTFLHCGTNPELYKAFGEIIHWPMIDIKPVVFTQAQKEILLQNFEYSDIIIFTSWFAGEYFLKELLTIKSHAHFDDKIFAVIGTRTQVALENYNIHATIVSKIETAQGLFQAITEQINVRGRRILFPRSSLPNPFLKEALSEKGAIVTDVTVYENLKPPKREFPPFKIDGVIFTSPSTVKNFLNDYATIPAAWQILAKGPVTLQTLQEAGYTYATSLS